MGLRVLVVDDDSMVLEIAASMLEELDCEVLRAQSATEALATIGRDQTIQILFTDINMPETNGYELAERVQHIVPKLQVILLSGEEVDSRGLPLIRKPFRKTDLLRIIDEVC